MKTKSPSDRELHTVSSLVTMGVIALTVFIIGGVGTDIAGGERDSGLDKAMRIEAAIAFKKPDKKKKQPQKRKKKKFKKPEQTFSRDEKADPSYEPTPRYWVPEAEVRLRAARVSTVRVLGASGISP